MHDLFSNFKVFFEFLFFEIKEYPLTFIYFLKRKISGQISSSVSKNKIK